MDTLPLMAILRAHEMSNDGYYREVIREIAKDLPPFDTEAITKGIASGEPTTVKLAIEECVVMISVIEVIPDDFTMADLKAMLAIANDQWKKESLLS